MGKLWRRRLYKFLSANCDPWNNGESTRQIKINGVRNRYYLLNDNRCPVPGKSYKDLEPKQIEIINNNYLKLIKRSAMRNQRQMRNRITKKQNEN